MKAWFNMVILMQRKWLDWNPAPPDLLISSEPGFRELHWRHHHWCHDDVIQWKHFPSYWPFVRGIHQSPVTKLMSWWSHITVYITGPLRGESWRTSVMWNSGVFFVYILNKLLNKQPSGRGFEVPWLSCSIIVNVRVKECGLQLWLIRVHANKYSMANS